MQGFFSDRPHPNPSLDFNIYAEHLYQVAMAPVYDGHGAFAIGIYGAWGSGKTTLMHSIRKKFEHSYNERYKTIWFNSWKYEGREAIWNALIQTILIEMEEDSSTEIVSSKAAELRKNINLYGRAFFRQLPKSLAKKYLEVDISKEDFDAINTLYSLDKEHYNLVNRFEYDFKKAVDNYVGKDGKLVIFIDDLDRCMPENALTVLEAIKLYLDYAKCVFFVGVDKKVIEQGVREKYSEKLRITGKDYVEKMIQVDFYIPGKNPDSVKNLLLGFMGKRWESNDRLWRMVIQATGCNVRKAKRFIYSFNLVEKIISEPEKIQDETYLLKIARILLLQMNFPEYFDLIQSRYSRLEDSEESDLLKSFIEKSMSKYNSQELIDDDLIDFINITSKEVAISEKSDLEKILQLLRQSGGTS
jgi:hypothetical protein